MPKFFKNLFSSTSSDDKKKDGKINTKNNNNKSEVKAEDKELAMPYDTRRKLSISRSGRMKQSLKARGKLGNDLFEEIPQKTETTKMEYHVNKSLFNDIKTNKDSESINNVVHEDEEVRVDLVKFEEDIAYLMTFKETNF